MKIGGIIATVLGVLMVISGIASNNDPKNQFRAASMNPGTGNGALILGIMLFAVGIVLLVIQYLKKNKINSDNSVK